MKRNYSTLDHELIAKYFCLWIEKFINQLKQKKHHHINKKVSKGESPQQ